MATGNLFLGTARRKVGDVVLYRRNGQQISRVRVRKVANPKSVGQALQRNYMAPVGRFFAPLAGVLERSWEGLDKSKSHSAFSAANIQLARREGWYVPKGAGFTPLPYKLTHGIIAPLSYEMSEYALTLYTASYEDNDLVSSFSSALVSMGYREGDQVTVIVVIDDYQDGNYRPAFSRFLVDTQSVATLASVMPVGVSTSQGQGGANLIVDAIEGTLVAGAVIISRYDNNMWRRSTQYLAVDPVVMANYTGESAYQLAVDSYRDSGGIIQSDVYLDGSPAGDTTPESIGVITVRSTNAIGYTLRSIYVTVEIRGSYTGNILVGVASRLSDGAESILRFRIGNDYITSFDTKAALSGVPEASIVAIEQNASLPAWLISHGVSEELFT